MVSIAFTPIRKGTLQLYPALSIKEAKVATDRYAAELITKLKVYPPPISKRYIRSFALRRGWRARPRPGAATYSVQVVNGAVSKGKFYAKWVQSRPTQQDVFVGRWKTWQDLIDRQEYKRRVQAAINVGIKLS